VEAGAGAGAGAGGATKSGSESDHEAPAAGVTRKTTAEGAFSVALACCAASSHTGSQFFAAASRATFPLKTVRLRPPGRPRTEIPEQETENDESGVPAASLGENQRASTGGVFFFFSVSVFPFFLLHVSSPPSLSCSPLSLSLSLSARVSSLIA